MKVVIDTNAFAMIEQFKIDLINEIKKQIPNAEIITIKQVIKELKEIQDKKAARYALDLIKKEGIKVFDLKKKGKTDDLLLEFAVKEKAALATNDKELKKKCLEAGVPVIYMRKKQKIEVKGVY